MPVLSIEGLQQYLRRLCDEAVPPEDAELLNRFVTANNREAFELLIARHGPMVLGTARRLVENTHDAIWGRFPLYDLLSLTTTSGSIAVTIDPQPADPDNLCPGYSCNLPLTRQICRLCRGKDDLSTRRCGTRRR